MPSLREIEVLKLLAQGYNCKEIGTILNISESTSISHKNSLKKKYEAKNVCHLVYKAFKCGIFSHS